MAETERRTWQTDHDLGGFAGGLLLGGLIVAGTMLLLASRAGKKARWRIQQIGRDWREQTIEAMDDRVAQVRRKAQTVMSSTLGEAEAAQEGDEAEHLFHEEALMVWGDEGGAVR